jgi:hypothetical protein
MKGILHNNPENDKGMTVSQKVRRKMCLTMNPTQDPTVVALATYDGRQAIHGLQQKRGIIPQVA